MALAFQTDFVQAAAFESEASGGTPAAIAAAGLAPGSAISAKAAAQAKAGAQLAATAAASGKGTGQAKAGAQAAASSAASAKGTGQAKAGAALPSASAVAGRVAAAAGMSVQAAGLAAASALSGRAGGAAKVGTPLVAAAATSGRAAGQARAGAALSSPTDLVVTLAMPVSVSVPAPGLASAALLAARGPADGPSSFGPGVWGWSSPTAPPPKPGRPPEPLPVAVPAPGLWSPSSLAPVAVVAGGATRAAPLEARTQLVARAAAAARATGAGLGSRARVARVGVRVEDGALLRALLLAALE